MAEDWLLTTVPAQGAYKTWKVYDEQAENNTRLWILGEKREIDGTTWWELLERSYGNGCLDTSSGYLYR